MQFCEDGVMGCVESRCEGVFRLLLFCRRRWRRRGASDSLLGYSVVGRVLRARLVFWNWRYWYCGLRKLLLLPI